MCSLSLGLVALPIAQAPASWALALVAREGCSISAKRGVLQSHLHPPHKPFRPSVLPPVPRAGPESVPAATHRRPGRVSLACLGAFPPPPPPRPSFSGPTVLPKGARVARRRRHAPRPLRGRPLAISGDGEEAQRRVAPATPGGWDPAHTRPPEANAQAARGRPGTQRSGG